MDPLGLEISWQMYIRKGSPVLRDELIKYYIPHVRAVVWKSAKHMETGECTIDDLIDAGYMGLIQAFDRFDPTVGYGPMDSRFKAWALLRIRGAAVDEARRFTKTPYRYTEQKKVVELQDEFGSYRNNFVINEEKSMSKYLREKVFDQNSFELTKEQQSVLFDYYFTNMTYSQIGSLMGVNGQRVQNIQKTAIQKIRRRLGKIDEEKFREIYARDEEI